MSVAAQESIALQMNRVPCINLANVPPPLLETPWTVERWDVSDSPVRALAALRYSQFGRSGFRPLTQHCIGDLCHLLLASVSTQNNFIATV